MKNYSDFAIKTCNEFKEIQKNFVETYDLNSYTEWFYDEETSPPASASVSLVPAFLRKQKHSLFLFSTDLFYVKTVKNNLLNFVGEIIKIIVEKSN